MEVNFNIYDGLVDFDENYSITPRLATSWNNPNKNIWRFNLREDVKFHNGYFFTADDVKFSIDYIKNNNSNVLKDLISSIKEVNVLDNKTVDIITYGTNPILLNKLVDIPIISKKYFESIDHPNPIGTGAYKLIDYVENDIIKLEKFDNYHPPQIQKLVHQ